MPATLLLILVLGVAPQALRPSIQGVVVDPAGSALAGATVRVEAAGAATVTTGTDGRFQVTVTDAGEHRIHVTLAGFQPFDSTVTVPPAGDAGAAESFASR